MARAGRRISLAWAAFTLMGPALFGCNAPPRGPEDVTRPYAKAPLEVMGPVIEPEPTTAMSRLARLNVPPVVLIPAESAVAKPKRR